MLVAASHIVYHLVFSKTTSSHPCLPGHLVFLEAFSAPLSPYQHPWGFSPKIASHISDQWRSQCSTPSSSFLSSPSQFLSLWDSSINITCHLFPPYNWVMFWRGKCAIDPLGLNWSELRSFPVCVCVCLLDGEPAVHRWGLGSFCL